MMIFQHLSCDHLEESGAGKWTWYVLFTAAFLARILNPPPPDPQAEALKKQLAPLRKQAEGKP